MRSVSCAIISFVLFYMALRFKEEDYIVKRTFDYYFVYYDWNCNYTNDIRNVRKIVFD